MIILILLIKLKRLRVLKYKKVNIYINLVVIIDSRIGLNILIKYYLLIINYNYLFKPLLKVNF